MGSLLGKKQALANDPFYNAVPPIGYYPSQLDPTNGLGGYRGNEEFANEYGPSSSIENLYGRKIRNVPNNLGGRYAQGLNQVPGMTPWNYGNYYLGNTTMQMMPLMLNKVAKYGQMQAMSALANTGLLGSNSAAMNTPYSMPSSCCTPMVAPMTAAATPLPVAFNPLVQGMYPMVSMSPVNWMCPSSFMSALTSGPMPYRPPAYDFPSNVGMVMTVPYGTPNPMISSITYGTSNNCGYSFSWCCSYSCAPAVQTPAQPMVCYYPNPVPVPVPQRYPVPCPYSMPIPNVQQMPAPCPYSMPIPNVQQMPVPHAVSCVAPPAVVGCNLSLPLINRAPLGTSNGSFTKSGLQQSIVMASNPTLSTSKLTENQSLTSSLPIYDTTDQSQLLIGRTVTSSVLASEQETNTRLNVTPSRLKYDKKQNRTRDNIVKRVGRYLPSMPSLHDFNFNYTRSKPRSDPALPPILNGYLISDSGWMPKHDQFETVQSILSHRKQKRLAYTNDYGKSTINSTGSRVSFLKRRQGKSSNSSVSEYECVICQQQRAKQHLDKHYSSSTISSLLSWPKGSNNKKKNRHYYLLSNESLLSSKQQTPTPIHKGTHKSHRRHPKKIKNNSKSSARKSTSPVLLHQSPILEPQENTIAYNYQQHKKNASIDNNKDDDDNFDDVDIEK